jgi:hypothetical protein
MGLDYTHTDINNKDDVPFNMGIVLSTQQTEASLCSSLRQYQNQTEDLVLA